MWEAIWAAIEPIIMFMLWFRVVAFIFGAIFFVAILGFIIHTFRKMKI